MHRHWGDGAVEIVEFDLEGGGNRAPHIGVGVWKPSLFDGFPIGFVDT